MGDLSIKFAGEKQNPLDARPLYVKYSCGKLTWPREA